MEDTAVPQHDMRTALAGIVPKFEGRTEESHPVDRQVAARVIRREAPLASLYFKNPFGRALAIGGADEKSLGRGVVIPLAGHTQKLP